MKIINNFIGKKRGENEVKMFVVFSVGKQSQKQEFQRKERL